MIYSFIQQVAGFKRKHPSNVKSVAWGGGKSLLRDQFLITCLTPILREPAIGMTGNKLYETDKTGGNQ